MYKKFTSADADALRAIVGSDRLLVGDAISEDYSHDELGGVSRMPDALVFVHTTEEVSAIMKYAYRECIPVTVRGSGTGLVGSAVPVEGGILMVTSQMNKILELDEDNLTVTVQPGVLLMELAAYVEERDFFYPPDPGEKSATIGGNISTNAGGMRAVKYGVTRDYDLTSGGEGLYLTGGTWQKIRWEKGTAAQAFTFYNEAGQELTVNPGKSYIALYGGFDGQSVMVKGGDEKLNPLNAMEPLPTPVPTATPEPTEEPTPAPEEEGSDEAGEPAADAASTEG